MKKLVHRNIDYHFVLNGKNVFQLVVKNKSEYFAIVSELKRQIEDREEGDFRLSENNNGIDLYKKVELITDIFSLNKDGKKVQNGLVKYLEEEYNRSNLKMEFNEFVTQTNLFVNDFRRYVDISFDFNEEIAYKDFLKFIKIKPLLREECATHLLLDYIDLCAKLLDIDVFIILNLSSLFSVNQLLDLVKDIQLMEVNLIFIESEYNDFSINDVSTIVIDEDLCEYYK